MRKFAFFLFLTTQGICMGQFNTLKSNISLYKVETVEDSIESTASPGREIPVIPDVTPQSPVMSSTLSSSDYDSIRASCLDCYYSVCPPLKALSITSRFGFRRNPFTHETTERHNGLDLRAPVGTEVYSMFSGVVIQVSFNEHSGKFISIRHGDYTISYCHLNRQLVNARDCVRAGDLIGLTGNTGRSTGPHLHLTVRRKGEYINPALLLNYIFDVRTHALEELGRLLG